MHELWLYFIQRGFNSKTILNIISIIFYLGVCIYIRVYLQCGRYPQLGSCVNTRSTAPFLDLSRPFYIVSQSLAIGSKKLILKTPQCGYWTAVRFFGLVWGRSHTLTALFIQNICEKWAMYLLMADLFVHPIWRSTFERGLSKIELEIISRSLYVAGKKKRKKNRSSLYVKFLFISNQNKIFKQTTFPLSLNLNDNSCSQFICYYFQNCFLWFCVSFDK